MSRHFLCIENITVEMILAARSLLLYTHRMVCVHSMDFVRYFFCLVPTSSMFSSSFLAILIRYKTLEV